MPDHVETLVCEANNFITRHNLDGQQAAFGGLFWGLLRAIAECPDCPGVFRVPLDEDWRYLRCPACGCVWGQGEQAPDAIDAAEANDQ